MSIANVARALGIGFLLAMSLVAITANARGGGGGTATITGTVYTVDTAKKSVTIKTSTGTKVKLAVGKSTAITRNGAPGSLKDLALNDGVGAQYKVSRLSATALSASGPAVTNATGKVSGVSLAGGVLSLGSRHLQTNANTRISRNGTIVSLRQITLQDALVAHVAMGTSIALDVVGNGPEESEVHGIISVISGNNVTIAPIDGSPAITIVVGATTLIEVNDGSGTLADLLVGQAVDAQYDPKTFAAFEIDVSGVGEELEVEGTVDGVDTTAGTVTITPEGGGPKVTLTVNAATQIDVNGDSATLVDIQVGMPIKAEYDAVTLLAAGIEAGGSGD